MAKQPPESLTDLNAWLSYIDACHPQDIALGLERVGAVTEQLGVRQFSCPVVTVAGTNGKGSCVRALQAMYQAAGYKTACFTSPYLVKPNEQIQVNGEMISDRDFCQALAQVEQARCGVGRKIGSEVQAVAGGASISGGLERSVVAGSTQMTYTNSLFLSGFHSPPTRGRGEEREASSGVDYLQLSGQVGIALTYFEFVTLAALYHMHCHEPDIVLLEVGLGGRLDATNIIDADVAVITSIALDHTAILGPDRESIGAEKSGIMRSGKPCVYSEVDMPPSVRAHAKALGCSITQLGQDFHIKMTAGGQQWQWENTVTELRDLPVPKLPLPSVAAALQVVTLLQPQRPVLQPAMRKVCDVGLLGRYQPFVFQDVLCILDGAHNPAAAKLLAQNLDKHPVEGKTYALFAAAADKDIPGIVEAISTCIDYWYITTIPGPRAADAAVVASELKKMDADCCHCPEPMKALQQAVHRCEPNDRLVVFGSFMLLGAILPTLSALNAKESSIWT